MDALATKYYSSYGTPKALSYFAEYERIIGNRRDQPLRILGLGVFSGASMLMWCDYAPTRSLSASTAKLSPATISGEKRIHFISGLQDDPATALRPAEIDILEDNCPVTLCQIGVPVAPPTPYRLALNAASGRRTAGRAARLSQN